MRTKPITSLKLRAVAENIRSFAQHFRQRTRLEIQEKQQAVVDILHAMASKSLQLMAELWVLQKPLTQPGLSIESSYIPTVINRYADRLSRIKILDEWRINCREIQPVPDQLLATTDRFSDNQNFLFSRFSSEYASPGSLATGALAQDWRSEINFWNLPIELLPPVVAKIKNGRAKAILVTQEWPAQAWYNQLLSPSEPKIYPTEEIYIPPL